MKFDPLKRALYLVLLAGLLIILPGCSQRQAAGVSFGMPTVDLVNQQTVAERTVIRYEHQSHPDWGYPASQLDYFNVVPAATTVKQAPLRVILHGAGKSGDLAMQSGLAAKEKEMHFYGDERFCLLYLDCRSNRQTDWWWGYDQIKQSADTYKDDLYLTEKRVLSTIEWVIQKYNIDRNRVYLSGISMGGSGSLGIGMCRGDVFAAVNVGVPARVEHMLFRLQSGAHPDPPPVVNFSSHIDRWSKDQEDFLACAHKNKYLVIFTWGLFGHTTKVRETDSVVNEFPWLEIRKNEAYPVFTDATTDDKYPGFLQKDAPDQQGQINGYFRWRSIEDNTKRLAMELRLVTREELENPVATPVAAVANVTFRRVQRFGFKPATIYKWRMTRGKTVLQVGKVRSDERGLVIIPDLQIQDQPATLTIEPGR